MVVFVKIWFRFVTSTSIVLDSVHLSSSLFIFSIKFKILGLAFMNSREKVLCDCLCSVIVIKGGGWPFSVGDHVKVEILHL